MALDQANGDPTTDLEEVWRSAHLEAGLGKQCIWSVPLRKAVERLAAALVELELDPAVVVKDAVPAWFDYTRHVRQIEGWSPSVGGVPKEPRIPFMLKHVQALASWWSQRGLEENYGVDW